MLLKILIWSDFLCEYLWYVSALEWNSSDLSEVINPSSYCKTVFSVSGNVSWEKFESNFG
jgi:hypothetical protein